MGRFLIDNKDLPIENDIISISVLAIMIIYVANIEATLNISNTDTSKYPLTSKNIVWTYFPFPFAFQPLLTQTTYIIK